LVSNPAITFQSSIAVKPVFDSELTLRPKFNYPEMKTISCITCKTRQCFIRAYTGKNWRSRIDNERITLDFKKNEVLFREGEAVAGIYFIYSGKVKVYNSGIQNKTQIVRFAGDGSIVGHRGFGTVNTYPIGAATIEDSTICYIPRSLFFDILQDNPPLTMELLNFYADELRRSERKLRSLSQLTVKQKITEAILTLAEIYGVTPKGKNEFLNVTLPRQDYSDITGASIEEVIRTISKLKKEGLIVTEGKQIGIANRKKLEEMLKDFGPLRLP
jgi:CRP/FNR family transcriptional regulator, anaerobic regulatory protein